MADMADRDVSAGTRTSTTEEEAADAVAETTREGADGDLHTERRAAVVFNPTKVELDVLKTAVASAETAAGWGPTIWLEAAEDDPGIAMAKEAVEAGAVVVLAAGGDGTVRAVAEGMRGSGVPLALLPAGTGNLLARNLELTLDHLEESVSTALTGEDRELDLGMIRMRRADGQTEEAAFVVMAGIGLDAQLMSNTDDELKKKVGWLAYAQSMASALKGGRRIHMRTRLDEQKARNRSVHTMLIGNCGSLPGNILLLPDAAVDDGILDVVTLRPEGPLGWIQIFWKVLVENAILRRIESGVGTSLEGARGKVRAMGYQRARKVGVRLDEPEPIELDGDEFGEVVGFDVWVEPGGLLTRVPTGSSV